MSKRKAQPKNYKGSEKLEQFFTDLGTFWQTLEPGEVKDRFGELLVTAHKLDDRVVQVEAEWWQQQQAEGQLIAAQENLTAARRRMHQYRAQRENARRDFQQVRTERDLIRAKYEQLVQLIGAAQQAFIEAEAQRTLTVQAALANVPETTAENGDDSEDTDGVGQS